MADQTYYNCTVGGAVKVRVKDGRIDSIRPIVLKESDKGEWTIEARGEKFSPPRKSTLGPFVFTEKQRVYNNRVAYPMIREDFDPKGERNIQNRGKSGYRRATWDEALEIVGGEISRVQGSYGKESITALTGSHHNWGLMGYKMSAFGRFFNMIGYTQVFDNPDSWEGFMWGAPHVYGYSWRLGCPEPYDMLEDCLQNTEMMVHWANDPDTIRGGYCGQETAIWRVWMKELGIKMIYIDPFCNFTAMKDATKWIAPRPGTDAALAEALAYVWVTEGTYDKDFIARKTHGFDEWKNHVLGGEDGVARTPAWAAELTGVREAVIVALAREWANHKTILSCGARGGWGGACRAAFGHEWARVMIYLAAMQGMGSPGRNLWGAQMGSPVDCNFFFPAYADPTGNIGRAPICENEPVNPVKQKLYRTMLPTAFLEGHIHWMGDGFCGKNIMQQFNQYDYPMEGYSPVHMLYRYGGSFMGTMSETNDWVRMYHCESLECVVSQSVWWDPETKFADVILPACTSFEREDIAEFAHPGGYSNHGFSGNNYRIIVYQNKCIEPVGESMSDYNIFTALSERLGKKEEYTENRSIDGWLSRIYANSDMPGVMTYEEFKKRGYYIVPVPEQRHPTPAYRWFYEDRACDTPDTYNPNRGTVRANLLDTPTGKLEFVAESLKANTPYDNERSPIGHYQHSWEGHKSPLYAKYPLHLISPHPRYGYHTHYDAHSDWLAEIPEHRVLIDGNYYLVVRLHPETAAARNIADGDLVQMINDRGVVIGVAKLTERVKPFTVHAYCSSGRYVPVVPGEPSADKGGCVNILTSKRTQSKYVAGFAPNSTLIEIAKWEGK